MNVCAEPPAGGAAMAAELSDGLFPGRLSASRPFSAFPRFPLGGRGRARGGRHTCEGQSRTQWPARPGAQRLELCWILGHECDAAPVAEAPFLLPLSPPPGSGTISIVTSPAALVPDSSLRGLSFRISSAASLLSAGSSRAPCSSSRGRI